MSAPTRRSRRRAPLLAGAAIAATAATLVAAPQAQATLASVSTTVDRVSGFPDWYSDGTTKLKLCVEADFCLGGNNLPDPDSAASLPDNFPDESFYAVARGETALNAGGRIRWRAVLEAAFANDAAIDGDQMTFTRVQVTGDKIDRSYFGKTIRFETPYGDLSAVVGNNGKLSRDRRETDPGDAGNRFAAPLKESTTTFGPTFVQWDKGAPPGFIGNPAVLHTIKGGDRNYFQAFVGTTAVSPKVIRFEVAGQLAP
jgi:hypothetical protein